MDRAPPVATCLTGLLALAVSAPGLLQGREGGAASGLALRPEKVLEGEAAAELKRLSKNPVYRLVTFIFVYETVTSLVCGAVVIWYFAGSFEKTVGTVKSSFLTVAFALGSALLYVGFWAAASGWLEVQDAKGFTPVAFAMLSTSIARSRMRRALLFGFNVHMGLVPWLSLCLACFVPGSSLLGNVCGLCLGNVYGYSYCFGLDLPESTASRLDQKFPFQLFRRIPGVKYISGSLAERRASQSRRINPVPGSYPTQKYDACPPAGFSRMQHPQAQPPGPLPPALDQSPAAFREPYAQVPFHSPSAPASASPSGTHLWIPKKVNGSLPAGPESLPAKAPSASADLCQVRVS